MAGGNRGIEEGHGAKNKQTKLLGNLKQNALIKTESKCSKVI